MALIGTLTTQQILRTGITPSFTAASSDGHYFNNDGRIFIQVKNTGAISTATFVTPYALGGQAVADLTVSIPATTGNVIIGPFQPDLFNDIAGRILVTFSSTTGVTLGAFRV